MPDSAIGSVEAPLLSEIPLQPGGDAEDATLQPDILSEHDDGPVRRHLRAQRVGHGLDESEHFHVFLRCICAAERVGISR